MRPRVALPELIAAVCSAGNGATRRDVFADEDGQCVDSIHIASEAPPDAAREVAARVNEELGLGAPRLEALGHLDAQTRSEPLALTQLILILHVLALQRFGWAWPSAVSQSPVGIGV